MKTLVKSLASTLVFGMQDGIQEDIWHQESAPHLYTRAICSDGDLVESLAGIRVLTQGLGFTECPETLYADGGISATYHVDHNACSVSLAVDCNTKSKTVSLAVSGINGDETWEQFQMASTALFGDC